MNRLPLVALVATIAALPVAAKADTILNLNATIPQSSLYNTANNLAPSFFSTLNLAAGTYTVSAIGTGVTANGVTSVYSGYDYKGDCSTNPCQPAPGYYRELTGLSTTGTGFSQASAANGYQDSYFPGSDDVALFAGNFNSTSAALAAASPYTFTLLAPTAVTFYVDDDSYLPTNNQTGFDDNTGGVSLDIKSVAATPEPSSLIMLGTGVLSAAGMIRRKLIVAR